MSSQLAGGSWAADLSVVTEHLVRNELHPQLARLALPAKMLQNAIKPAPRASSELSRGPASSVMGP
jgi:hypothetical protein